MTIQSGNQVRLTDDGRIYTVHTVYSDTHVSLGLYDYPDVEQDNQTPISKLTEVTV